MKAILRILVAVFLLLSGIGAVYGGWRLINRTDGSGVGMEIELLADTPFHDFLIPGIILFAVSGLFSMIALVMLFANSRKYPLLVYIAGIILTGWIMGYCFLSREVNLFHFVLGAIGLILMACGIILNRFSVFDDRMHFIR